MCVVVVVACEKGGEWIYVGEAIVVWVRRKYGFSFCPGRPLNSYLTIWTNEPLASSVYLWINCSVLRCWLFSLKSLLLTSACASEIPLQVLRKS